VKRILVPLDGTPLSEAVIPLATTLARGHGAELLLVRARRRQGFPEVEIAAREEAEAYLALTARNLAGHHVAVQWTVCCDEPDRGIAATARDRRADLVVMSTHGRGAVTSSVAERVLQQVPVPVLFVRGQFVWQGGGIGKIVVPLDGSELAEDVLPLVAELGRPFDFTIDLLRAVEPVPRYAPVEISAAKKEEMRRVETTDAEAYLTRAAGPLEVRGLRVTRSTAYGPAGDVIVRHAGDVGAGLIAMNTHARTGLGRLGSVAEHVLRAAPVPVLLGKASAESR
jgi:nucleotide-binding universal stress UspA family protein